jgi:hypothetical protein
MRLFYAESVFLSGEMDAGVRSGFCRIGVRVAE